MTSALSPALQNIPALHPVIAIIGIAGVSSCMVIFKHTQNKLAHALWFSAMVFMIFFTLNTIFG